MCLMSSSDQLLGLVHGVLAFTGVAHAVALDGLDQQHGGLALVLLAAVEGGIHLLRVVATTAQVPDFVVGHVLDQLRAVSG